MTMKWLNLWLIPMKSAFMWREKLSQYGNSNFGRQKACIIGNVPPGTVESSDTVQVSVFSRLQLPHIYK